MSDLVAFLKARIDEDEAIAKASLADVGGDYHGMGCEMSEAGWRHINRHDPARVLADVAAARAVLDLEPDSGAGPDAHIVWTLTVEALTLPYAEHRDYRQEWKP